MEHWGITAIVILSITGNVTFIGLLVARILVTRGELSEAQRQVGEWKMVAVRAITYGERNAETSAKVAQVSEKATQVAEKVVSSPTPILAAPSGSPTSPERQP